MGCIKMKAVQFKRMDDPVKKNSGRRIYQCYVKIDDIPEGITFETNPREQNLNKDIPKQIESSLLSNDGDFHIKNRGIVISAQKVSYDTKKEEAVVVFGDPYEHGDIDGGHTYFICLKHKGKGLNQYVRFEIMIGVEDIIEELAAARNTSEQVDDKSLAELAKKFDPIKDAIDGVSFFNRIAFKQNQKYTEDGKKQKMMK